jgi:3-deoxy-D-manno-octulosonate 8-phosphate phosphatase (KDO 8-P phosphatase)
LITKSNLTLKLKKIKVIATDVDGVLTDGGVYYTHEGESSKKFYIRDGMGINILLRNQIPTIIITKEKNLIIKKWSKKMNVTKLYQGILKKESILHEICSIFKISSKELAYIGDDVNDIDLLKSVGFSATPNDGILEAKKICDYTCNSNGGSGAFREIADLIIKSQNLIPR